MKTKETLAMDIRKRESYKMDGIGIRLNRPSHAPSTDVDQLLGALQRTLVDHGKCESRHWSEPLRMLSTDAFVIVSVSSPSRIESSDESESASSA
jgi:hypothetical protein